MRESQQSMSGVGSSVSRRLLTPALLLVAASCGSAEGTFQEEVSEERPVAVRVTEISPEVADQIAGRVAERMRMRATHPGDPMPPALDQTTYRPPTRVVGVGGSAGGKFKGQSRKLTERHPTKGTGRNRTEALEMGLDWLAAHQSPDGRWSAAGFGETCEGEHCQGGGEAQHDIGVTGLATLAFLGAGYTHHGGGPYAKNVRKALQYLRTVQDAEGHFGSRTSPHHNYDHGVATLAMTEAYGLTGARILKESAETGVKYVLSAQNPYMGWRYGVRDGDNDTPVTCLMVTVLASARQAGIDVDGHGFKGAIAWLDRMTEPEFGRVGYQNRGGHSARMTEAMGSHPPHESEALTAQAIVARALCGQEPSKTDLIRKGAVLLGNRLPVWDPDHGLVDMYYWWWGTLASVHVGGDLWRKWNEALGGAVVDSQRTGEDSHVKGSWDPVGPWGRVGGRVYSTALMCMTLEASLRYATVVAVREK